MDSVLIGPPDTIAALSLQFGVERLEQSKLVWGEEGIVTFEQFILRLYPGTSRPLVQLGACPESKLSFVWKFGHTSSTTAR